jgi:hypothetical protein
MKKYLTLLFAFALVTAQFVDIAAFGTAPLDVPGIHIQADHDQGKQSTDGYSTHCCCHPLHHMGLDRALAGLVDAPVSSVKFPLDRISARTLGQSPPVPPPNA